MTLMHKGYKAYTDQDGTMREITIIGNDHKKYYRILDPLPDGTVSVERDKCYYDTKIKTVVRKELMNIVFSKVTEFKEPIKEDEEDEK